MEMEYFLLSNYPAEEIDNRQGRTVVKCVTYWTCVERH
jgi:hypothetical protein